MTHIKDEIIARIRLVISRSLSIACVDMPGLSIGLGPHTTYSSASESEGIMRVVNP